VNGFLGLSVDGQLLLPILIFFAELCVLTLATLRTIAVARGMKYVAPLLGVFEVSIWLFAVGKVMQNLSHPACYAAFAAGFALGNYLGICIERKLAIGNLVVRVITRKDVGILVEGLRGSEFGVTCVEAQGTTGPVNIVLSVIKRKELEKVVAILKRFDPKVFYSVDDLQSAEGVFPLSSGRPRGIIPSWLNVQRAA
jgi:uncharacterized protein YebE (UPF0316 family)